MKKYASINDLPNELLIIIFQLLYKMHRKHDTVYRYLNAPSMQVWAGNPFAPSMFPFAQAKVCQRWCAVLAYSPVYWTRIAIAIDSPLHIVANYFSWSQALPIEVFVQSCPDRRSMQASDEKSCVAAVLPYISLNLRRIKRIEFSLIYRTSFPHLRRWLSGQADILESIVLSHKENRITEAVVSLVEPDADDQEDGDQLGLHFSAPNLRSLTLDGQMFARAYRSNSKWLANAPRLTRINLVASEPFSPAEPISIRATIEALSRARSLRFLYIRGIHFLDDHTIFRHPFLHLPSITLEDLTSTAVSTFVRGLCASLRELTIKHCSLLDLNPSSAAILTLEDLEEECDLTLPFSDLKILGVSIGNCPAFNDAFLNFMADGGFSGEDFPAKGMMSLALRQCTNFDVENLYRMILARRNAMEASPTWDGTIEGLTTFEPRELSAIVSLHVTSGPFLSAEYKSKFKQLVPEFRWTSAEKENGNKVV